MSPWLFNIYMDDVIREVNATIFSRGLSFINTDDRVEDKPEIVCRRYSFSGRFRREIVSAGERIWMSVYCRGRN